MPTQAYVHRPTLISAQDFRKISSQANPETICILAFSCADGSEATIFLDSTMFSALVEEVRTFDRMLADEAEAQAYD